MARRMKINPFRSNTMAASKIRTNIILYSIIAIQTMVILILMHRSSHANLNITLGYNKKSVPFYDPPLVHSSESQISRVWHSNGSPFINPDLHTGTCWCSGANDYCLCTPSLAIDTILISGDNHLWLVKRKDTGKFATPGGFVEVGETSEEAVHREVKEELDITLRDDDIHLFGIYDDPLRDARRHTVSAVYVVDIPEDVKPEAGDDAASVVRIAYGEIEHLSLFADHKQILREFINMKRNKQTYAKNPHHFRRSLCITGDTPSIFQ